MRAGTRAVLLLVSLGLAAAGCTGLPDSGPVVDADISSSVDDAPAPDFNPAPPAPGASGLEVVNGFLVAMTASPISTDVAMQYLSSTAREEWKPDASTITYSGNIAPTGTGLQVSVVLPDAARLDASGAWQGRLVAGQERLDLDLTVEDGEYRITNPPDALVVPTSWFAQRFQQASLYFFDPSARILVPQPVYVPRGEQRASGLISGLVAGPGPGLDDIVRSFLPAGLEVSVSVPVSAAGIADISFVGEQGELTPATIERMFAQLAWTLRQEPSIRAFRVTIGDEVVRTPDGDDEYGVERADAYDPTGESASQDMFALSEGVLTRRDGNSLAPVSGPFGTSAYGVRVAAVSLDAAHAAAVSADGRSLLTGPVGDDDEGVREVVAGTDLLRPGWDFADRIWVVDRSATGAVVWYVARGRARVIDVPGVSGRQVRRFLISRDGTRFVAVVRGAQRDELRIGRVEVDDRGGIDRVMRTEQVAVAQGPQARIKDVAWTSPTTIGVLTPVVAGEIFEVRTVSVDGSPTSGESLSAPITEPVEGLAGSPEAGLSTYGVTRTSLIDLTEEGTFGFVDGEPRGIGYVG